jgi:hypothetical protein
MEWKKATILGTVIKQSIPAGTASPDKGALNGI